MTDITKIAIKGTTQDNLQVADISDDLVILKDGSAVLIIQVMAVNFGLLSEQEQEAIIYAYAGLLNSLNFAIQIVIRSQQKDISSYVEQLDLAAAQQKNSLLRDQIVNYRQFIVQTVKQNNVLDKKFYIAIPFSYLELGVTKSAGGLISKKKKGLPYPVQTIVERARISLLPKRDHILRQLGRLGLRAKQMTNPELIELFYDIYNHGREMAATPNKVGLNQDGEKSSPVVATNGVGLNQEREMAATPNKVGLNPEQEESPTTNNPGADQGNVPGEEHRNSPNNQVSSSFEQVPTKP